jgi:uncharacterized membrane protein YebE (DUF533 family)
MTTSSGVRTIQLKAYPSTIHVVDTNNSPLAGVKVVVVFSNSTSKTLTTNSQGIAQLGRVPAGNYVAQLTYQNQDMGKWTADPSDPAQRDNTIRLNVGSTATSSQVSAVVLLTIFGIAFFLVLLAIKVRKTPPPPKI